MITLQQILAIDLATKIAGACSNRQVKRCVVRSSGDVFARQEFFDVLQSKVENVALVTLTRPPFAEGSARNAALALDVVSKLQGNLKAQGWRSWLPYSASHELWRLLKELRQVLGRGQWSPLVSQALSELLCQIDTQGLRVVILLDLALAEGQAREVSDFIAWHLQAARGLMIRLDRQELIDPQGPLDRRHSEFEISSAWALKRDAAEPQLPLLDAARNTAAWSALFESFAEQASSAAAGSAIGSGSTHDAEWIDCSILPRKLYLRGKRELDLSQKVAPERWLMMDLLHAVAPDFYRALKRDPIQGPIDFFNWLLGWGDKFAGNEKRIEKSLQWPNNSTSPSRTFDLCIRSLADSREFLDAYFGRQRNRQLSSKSILESWIVASSIARQIEGSLTLNALDDCIRESWDKHGEELLLRNEDLPSTPVELLDGIHQLRRLCDTLAMQPENRKEVARLGLHWLRGLKEASDASAPSVPPYIIKAFLAAFFVGIERPTTSTPSWQSLDGRSLEAFKSELVELEKLECAKNVPGTSFSDTLSKRNDESLTSCMTVVRMRALCEAPGTPISDLLIEGMTSTISSRGLSTSTLHARLVAILWALARGSSADEGERLLAGLRLSAWVEHLQLRKSLGNAPETYVCPLVFASYRRLEDRRQPDPIASALIKSLLSKVPPLDTPNGGRLQVDRVIEQPGVTDWNETLLRWLFLSDAQFCFVDDRYYESRWCLLELLVAIIRSRLEGPGFRLVIYRMQPDHEAAMTREDSQGGAAEGSQSVPESWQPLVNALKQEVKLRATSQGGFSINKQGDFVDQAHLDSVANEIKRTFRYVAGRRDPKSTPST